eukprot:3676359-Amphidinium_carterae.1
MTLGHFGGPEFSLELNRATTKKCKADRAIVLAAVQQDGSAIRCAAKECKADREIMLVAMQI